MISSPRYLKHKVHTREGLCLQRPLLCCGLLWIVVVILQMAEKRLQALRRNLLIAFSDFFLANTVLIIIDSTSWGSFSGTRRTEDCGLGPKVCCAVMASKTLPHLVSSRCWRQVKWLSCAVVMSQHGGSWSGLLLSTILSAISFDERLQNELITLREQVFTEWKKSFVFITS